MAKRKPLIPSTDNYTSEFIKIFDHLPSQHHRHKLFDDWLNIAACTAHQEPYHLGFLPKDDSFTQVEEKYMQAIRGYTTPELNTFAELYALTKLALHHTKSDFLGHLFMQLELGNKDAGQFFTPYPVSLLMARMTLAGINDIIQEKGYFTLQEPACGGGSMLIAVAQCLEEMGHDPGNVMFFEAIDISHAAFNMTFIQTSFTGLNGRVTHGNTLSGQTWEHRFTPISKIFWWRTNHMLRSIYDDPQPAAAASAPQPSALPTAPAQIAFDLEMPTSNTKRPRGVQGTPKPNKQIEVAQPTLF